MRSDFWVPAAVCAGSLYLWTLAVQFRGGAARYELIGPDFFPKILLACLVAVSLWQLARTWYRRRRQADDGEPSEAAVVHFADLTLAVAVTVGYVVALHFFGFVPATLLFQGLMLAIVFRQRDWRVLFGVPAGLTALFFVIFIELMSTPLPRGRGVFLELNRFLY